MGNSTRYEYSHTIFYEKEREEVFRLFCPVAEYGWVAGWACRMIYTGSGIAEKNCIFTTKHAPMPEDIWVCSRYDFGNEVEYVKVTPGYLVTVINIRTFEQDLGTSCIVSYTHTALCEAGEDFMSKHLTRENFIKQIEGWVPAGHDYLSRLS